jgi:hypothetical protein
MPEHKKGVDETPESFEQLKPPGYWNGEYFVEVRLLTDEEAQERYEQLRMVRGQRRVRHPREIPTASSTGMHARTVTTRSCNMPWRR